MFSLVVDDFGIKYVDKADVEHLLQALRLLYRITFDWSGTKYLGFTIDHDKTSHTISISLPEYIPRLLERLQIPKEGPVVLSPAPYTFVPRGKQDTAEEQVVSPSLVDPKRIKKIEVVVGSLLYYARWVDSTILCDVNRLGSQQSEPTEATDELIYILVHIINYAATFPHVKVTLVKNHNIVTYCLSFIVYCL